MSALVLAISTTGFSQLAEKKEDKKVERIKVVKGGESKPVSTEKTTKVVLSPEEELKSCEAQLDALNKKETYLRSNPEQLKVAEENGWFADAEKTRAVLTKRINELKSELKK